MQKEKIVAISGASGFVGSELSRFLLFDGYEVLRITRSDLSDEQKLVSIVERADILINLSGASILARWSESYKRILRESRIGVTQKLFSACAKAKKKPSLLISTSAMGIYDTKGYHNEQSEAYGDDFLALLCKDWEKSALRFEEFGCKVVIFRLSVVLGKGGALKQMLTPFKLALGGNIGDGKQAFCFIHIEDLLRAYEFVIKHDLSGIFNLASPSNISNEHFTKTLAKLLSRPAFFHIPEFFLKFIFADGAKILINTQKIKPTKLLENGFVFRYQSIEKALANILFDGKT